jgi:transcription factor E2F7/8
MDDPRGVPGNESKCKARRQKRSLASKDQDDPASVEPMAYGAAEESWTSLHTDSNCNSRSVLKGISNNPAKRPKRSVRTSNDAEEGKENRSIGLSTVGLLMSAEELSNASCSTPTKSRQPPIEDDPLTPTTNLKVLLSAISPALRDRESKRRKGLIFSDDVNEGEKKPTDSDDQIEKAKNKQKRPEYSRKDKSLAKLCSRFLDLFDKEDNVGKTIYLDNAAKQLGVERRRVYDIVNVLESLEIAKREAKNQYLWKGRSQLPATVTKLRAHAHQKGLMPKLDLQQSEELSVETIRENIQKLPGKSANVSDSENEEVGKDVEDKEPQKKCKCT